MTVWQAFVWFQSVCLFIFEKIVFRNLTTLKHIAITIGLFWLCHSYCFAQKLPVIRYTPYENGRMKYYVLPISPVEGHENALKMSASEQSKMTNWAAKTRAHLAEFGAVEKKFTWKEMIVQ